MDLTNTLKNNDASDCSTEQNENSSPSDNDKLLHKAHQFGRDVNLAMACMNGAERLRNNKPVDYQSTPKLSASELRTKLHTISAQIDTHRAELIRLLVEFDEHKGWSESGARNCADWANAHLGIAKSTVYEFLRVGKELKTLPIISALFRGGELSWSKTKVLTRVADADNERDLAHVALSATVCDVERICREFRWPKLEAESGDPETGQTATDLRAEQQLNNRSLTWQEQNDGSILIRVTLPPEKAQVVLKSLEHCENELYEANSDCDEPVTSTQRRADAMVEVAERSLQYAGTDVRRSDRYQVILHVENSPSVPSVKNPLPAKVPWIEGVGPIADSVASRISCDASVVSILTQDGEPLNVGRKTRTWPTGIWRAIMSRDRHCQFPGCSEHRYLEIHHIQHWANGGDTSVDNGICLCQHHHTLVHESGYRIERNTIETNNQASDKNFGVTIGLVSSAKKVLLPTRQRFRFIKPAPASKSSHCCTNECNESRANYVVSHNKDIALDLAPSQHTLHTCIFSQSPRKPHTRYLFTWRRQTLSPTVEKYRY